MNRLKRTRILVGAVLFLMCSLMPLGMAHADPTCTAGKVMNIVAHPDDDLLFINPKIQQDIDAGKCVEAVYVTAGASADAPQHWQNREAGIAAAYAYMTGEPGVNSPQSITIDGHTATRYTVQNKPEVSMVFMRIPEANPSLLWNGDISSIQTVDSAATYTKQGLIDALHARMATYQPSIIRTLNFSREIDPQGNEDNIDHTSVAYFAQAAHYNYTVPHQFIGYIGYEGVNLAANVSGTTLTTKQNAYFAYDPYDSDATSHCSDVATCNKPDFLNFMERNYEVTTQTRDAWSFQDIDGSTTATSQTSGDVGKQPATIQYGSDLYAFYFDAASQDLKYAKASSSSSPQWTFGTVDVTGDVGYNPTPVVYNNQLHVFYYRKDTGNLRHAVLNSGAWSTENLDGDPGSIGHFDGDVGESSTAVVYGTSLQLFYYDKTNGNARHAWLNNSTWNFEDFDGGSTSNGRVNANVGLDPSAMVHTDGSLQLFYYDATNGNLRHVWESNGWHFEDLDGNATTNGRYNANVGVNPTVVSYSGTVQLFYYDVDHQNLRHAWSDTNGWHFENLEGDKGSVTRYDGNTGITPSAVVQGTTLHVFSYDGNGSLRHAWTSSSQGWQAERLDGFGDDGAAARVVGAVGQDPSPVVYGTNLHVFYYDEAHTNLRHATL